MKNNNSHCHDDVFPDDGEASMHFSFLQEEASLGSFPAYMASTTAAPNKLEPMERQGEEVEEVSEKFDTATENEVEPSTKGQKFTPNESTTMIPVSLNGPHSAEFSQRSILLEEGSVHTGKQDCDQGDLQEVDLKEEDMRKEGQEGKGKGTNNSQVDDDDQNLDQQSVLSDSEGEEEASTIDLDEEAERKNRKSVLLAIFTACGIIFVLTLITRYCNRSKNEDQVMETAAEEAAQEVGDQAGMAMMRGGLLVKQQSIANLGNPAIM
jgi:hypothetical protein